MRRAGGDRSGRQAKRPGTSTTSKNGVDYTHATKAGCSSGKWAWLNTPEGRKGAKSLIRALKKAGGEGKGLREYVCPECDRWHVGHLPYEARRGLRSADAVYAKRNRRQGA